jgi:hypothetical protein
MSEVSPAAGGLHTVSVSPVDTQASPAEKLTRNIGGTWHRRLGRCTCPVCERPHSLLIEDGNRAPLVTCMKGCSRRTIISIARARGWLS